MTNDRIKTLMEMRTYTPHSLEKGVTLRPPEAHWLIANYILYF